MSSKLSYLQKYLSSGETLGDDADKKKKKKKKDKKSGSHGGGFKIIDDDGLGASSVKEKEKSKKKATKYVDKGERPRLKESKKGVSDSDEDELSYGVLEDRPQIAGFVDERPEVEIMKERRFTTSTFKTIVKSEDEDDDAEPKKPSSSFPNILPDFKIKEEPRDQEDESPPRSKRRQQRKERHDSSDSDDASPPRQRRRHDSSDGDASPPRRGRHDSSEGDNSPPRSRRRDDDGGDQSPPRKRDRAANNSDADNSPPRRKSSKQGEERVKTEPVLIKPDPDGDMSPPRRGGMAKTLDGKKAGLQRAADLKGEMETLREREKEKFRRLDASVSGRGAETMVRGRLKAKKEEEEEKRKKNEITDEVKAQYKKWSKGVKQAAVIQQKIAEDLAEMDKPLTRTKDDVDVNDHLRDRERAEDPMVEYFRKKRTQKAGTKRIPTYQGPLPPPNRFKVMPGYRWDGVDRSTGFEQRFHERINRQKRNESEAYAWSTEDM